MSNTIPPVLPDPEDLINRYIEEIADSKTVVASRGGDMSNPCLHEKEWGEYGAWKLSVDTRLSTDEGERKALATIMHQMDTKLAVMSAALTDLKANCESVQTRKREGVAWEKYIPWLITGLLALALILGTIATGRHPAEAIKAIPSPNSTTK